MAKMKEKSFFLWSRKVFGLATYLGKKSLFCHVHFLFLFIYKKKWMGLFLCHSSVPHYEPHLRIVQSRPKVPAP